MKSESGKSARPARRRTGSSTCTLPAPEDKSMTLMARRLRHEGLEQWTATLTLGKGARVIELGPYKTPGRAMITGLHVYYEWTMPPRLRRKYWHLLEDPPNARGNSPECCRVPPEVTEGRKRPASD
jgi:hypothetical protein